MGTKRGQVRKTARRAYGPRRDKSRAMRIVKNDSWLNKMFGTNYSPRIPILNRLKNIRKK